MQPSSAATAEHIFLPSLTLFLNISEDTIELIHYAPITTASNFCCMFHQLSVVYLLYVSPKNFVNSSLYKNAHDNLRIAV